MFRIDNKMAPQYLLDRFTSRTEISQTNTRSTCHSNYEIPLTRLEMSKQHFVYQGVKTWYVVPPELKMAKNPKSFRCEIARVWKRREMEMSV